MTNGTTNAADSHLGGTYYGEGRGPRHGLQMTIKQSVTEDGRSNPTDASEYEYEAYVVN